MEINSVINELKENGAAVLKDLYDSRQIESLNQYQILLDYNLNKLLNDEELKCNSHSIYRYKYHFDIERIKNKNQYNFDNYEILEIVKGRYDICKLNSKKNLNTYVEEILDNFIQKENRIQKWGLLTSTIKSNDVPWHRDTVNICGDPNEYGEYNDTAMVHGFDPFYFTVLIPLVPLTYENGTPEFIKGSHKMTYSEMKNKNCEILRFETELGDAIIFDGRIFHRGRENISNVERPVLYNVIHRDWYVET